MSMSSQVRNERRDKSKFPEPHSLQEWVPRGSNTAAKSQTSNIHSNFNGNGRESYHNIDSSVSQHRGNHRGRRAQEGRPRYPRMAQNRGKESDENSRKKVFKEANVPMLVQEIQEKLVKSTVECMICYELVRRSAPIWSCSSCYSIFHLNCIRKWAQAPTSVDLLAEKNQGVNWRCPGCQSVQLSLSREIQYVCFCGKMPDPSSDLYLTPHSCGEHCGKTLEREITGAKGSKEDFCPHVCVMQCHPGPCPPCKAFAPPRSCPCGKKTITTRCSERKSDLTCGQRCNKLLNCSRHRCEKICHIGPCDSCQLLVNASCFCKKKMEVVLCGDMTVKGEVDATDGVFSCDSTCGRMISCGNHLCGGICHPGSCLECDFMPEKIKTCCCGKTSLREARTSCLDPIPICSELCGKLLPCGLHHCNEMCHRGDCSPCSVQVLQKCRCGSNSRMVECYKTSIATEILTCDRPCGQKKSCGRHRCSERCCPSSDSGNLLSGEWDPHLCSMTCGKKLRCGQHSCESLCHSGHCPPCLETIFSDLTCSCGRTALPPPLPCGTPRPSCQLPCSVPQPCGHLSSHNCHFGDCPPCAVPISKECIGGHVVLRNIPCGSRDIRCNKLCGKTRKCGMHACGRTCHLPPCDILCGSESESESESDSGQKVSCGQTCGAPRKDCRHSCCAPCHPHSPCPDTRCNVSVTITCSCNRISATVPCGVGQSCIAFNSDTLLEASIIQKLPVPLQPVEGNGRQISLGHRKLMCDDECAKLERRRTLADAFDITTPSLESLNFGEDSNVSELVADLFRRDAKWVLSVEDRCKFLVLGKHRGTMMGVRSHVFCPMAKDKRDAVRLIAGRWKLAVTFAGWEPKQFVAVHVTAKSKAPARVLGAKGSIPTNAPHLTAFDPFIDMDPRLLVSFPDLPREANISPLVLRFGGECELVWLNDKNALAVFNDTARAATALRRLDNGTVYHGASVLQTVGVSATSSGANAWGKGGNPWKTAVVEDSCWKECSWSGSSADDNEAVWKKEAPIPASMNRWLVLEPEAASSSSSASIEVENSRKETADHSVSHLELHVSGLNSGELERTNVTDTDMTEVVDDWEKAYE